MKPNEWKPKVDQLVAESNYCPALKNLQEILSHNLEDFDINECWYPWKCKLPLNGYPSISDNCGNFGRTSIVLVHTIVYQHYHDRYKTEKTIRHKCNVHVDLSNTHKKYHRACLNPLHLTQGSVRENARDTFSSDSTVILTRWIYSTHYITQAALSKLVGRTAGTISHMTKIIGSKRSHIDLPYPPYSEDFINFHLHGERVPIALKEKVRILLKTHTKSHRSFC